MKISNLLILLAVISLTACNMPKNNKNEIPMSPINELAVRNIIQKMKDKFGTGDLARIEKGVRQAASLWRNQDGTINDFENFCLNSFIKKGPDLEEIFTKVSTNFESLNGYFNSINLDIKRQRDVNTGSYTPIDELFAAYEPSSHLSDDFFNNKIAFIIALNFPAYSLKEKNELGPGWSRREWAYARLGDMFACRLPADVVQNTSQVLSNAENYIASYNIFMGNITDEKGDTFFPKNLKLISHWGLRDELKSHYADTKNGLEKQRLIYEVMKRIVMQEIPDSIINNPGYQWDPVKNKLYKNGKEITFKPEANIRYDVLLKNFLAEKAVDKYCPLYPTYIQRTFDQEMEMTQANLENLFIEFVSSPEVKQVANLISKRLGRNLEPFDIWYDGFKARSTMSENELTEITRKKYPDTKAFEKNMPEFLEKLGFSPEKSAFISTKVCVDPARGSGHAWGTQMKGDKSHLRTRIGEKGMDYKGYNIACHEFGHNVEQTISMQDVDYYMLSGVPSSAFTEANAFIFQNKDLDILGIKDENPDKPHLKVLDNFWSIYEIMGVSLVDMNVWKWLYAHPDATPEQLKNAVIDISKDIWNKYYAGVFGVKDQVILAIYSHMINYPLYLSAYPIGYIIEFQLEKQMQGKNFGNEEVRIYSYGRIIPRLWMKHAVGNELSVKPLLEATDNALAKISYEL